MGPVSVHSFHELMQKESLTILKQARGIMTKAFAKRWAILLPADDTQVEALTLTIPNQGQARGVLDPTLAEFPVLAIFLVNSFGYTMRKINLPYWQQLHLFKLKYRQSVNACVALDIVHWFTISCIVNAVRNSVLKK